jgi:dihydrofolate reductase
LPPNRRIIVYVATSADGFIARPDGGIDWLDRPRPKGNYGMGEFYKSIDTVLWGRKTCDMALDCQKRGMPGTDFDTRVKNYVFTHGPFPSPAPAGVEFVNEPIKPFGTRLRAKKGKNIWIMGGADIIASLLDEGEIDEFIIHVIPVLIGEGIPLVAPRHRPPEAPRHQKVSRWSGPPALRRTQVARSYRVSGPTECDSLQLRGTSTR